MPVLNTLVRALRRLRLPKESDTQTGQKRPISATQTTAEALGRPETVEVNKAPPKPKFTDTAATPVYTDPLTGQATGFIKDGKTFFGKPQDISKATRALEEKRLSLLPPTTAQTAQTFDIQRQQAALQQEALNRQQLLAGGVAPLKYEGAPQEVNNPLISPSTIGTTLASAGGIGAVAGGVTAATGIGAPLAPVAAVLAGTTALVTKITLAQKQDLREAFKIYKTVNQNMAAIIDRLNHDPTYSPQQALQEWNEELYNMEIAEINLNNLNNSPIKRTLSGSGEENIEFQRWKARQFPALQAQFNAAFVTPNAQAPLMMVNNQGVVPNE